MNKSPEELRQWAAQCDARAKDPLATAQENELLRRMKESLLAVAETQEWLAGDGPRDGA